MEYCRGAGLYGSWAILNLRCKCTIKNVFSWDSSDLWSFFVGVILNDEAVRKVTRVFLWCVSAKHPSWQEIDNWMPLQWSYWENNKGMIRLRNELFNEVGRAVWREEVEGLTGRRPWPDWSPTNGDINTAGLSWAPPYLRILRPGEDYVELAWCCKASCEDSVISCEDERADGGLLERSRNRLHSQLSPYRCWEASLSIIRPGSGLMGAGLDGSPPCLPLSQALIIMGAGLAGRPRCLSHSQAIMGAGLAVRPPYRSTTQTGPYGCWVAGRRPPCLPHSQVLMGAGLLEEDLPVYHTVRSLWVLGCWKKTSLSTTQSGPYGCWVSWRTSLSITQSGPYGCWVTGRRPPCLPHNQVVMGAGLAERRPSCLSHSQVVMGAVLAVRPPCLPHSQALMGDGLLEEDLPVYHTVRPLWVLGCWKKTSLSINSQVLMYAGWGRVLCYGKIQ